MFTKKETQLLLEIARNSIKDSDYKPNEKDIPDSLKEKRGVFVTLTIDNELRGCIGYIMPLKPLYIAVLENARNAAYSDPRFPPLSKEEFNQIHIEISVLTVPKKLNFKNSEELLKELDSKPGVILSKGFYQSTFLPQVWEQLPKKEEFLQHLCLKAGLPRDQWKHDIKIETYSAEVIEE